MAQRWRGDSLKPVYATAILSRHRSTLTPIKAELADTRGFECDVSDPASVESTFARIGSELGEVNMLLYNAGSRVFGDVETITPDQFEQAWRVNAYGSLLGARQVIPGMKARGAGAIIFIGAPSRRRPNRRVRSGQGRAAQPCGVNGAQALARGRPRRADRHRWRG
jgi:NAD(P)-dependent dehydrogenase (short-subunit alcohol dehydrogenase family)